MLGGKVRFPAVAGSESRMSSLTMMITLEKAVQNFELRVLAEAFLAVR
jgi:hypothetical protein